MSRLDLILLGLLALFALRGFARGFFRESFGLLGLAAGALAASRWGQAGAGVLRAEELVPRGSELLVASLAIVIAVWLVAVVLGRIAEGIARALFLGGLNRIAGVAVGAVKGAALLGIGLLVAEWRWPTLSHTIAGSRVARPLIALAREAIGLGRELGVAPVGRHV